MLTTDAPALSFKLVLFNTLQAELKMAIGENRLPDTKEAAEFARLFKAARKRSKDYLMQVPRDLVPYVMEKALPGLIDYWDRCPDDDGGCAKAAAKSARVQVWNAWKWAKDHQVPMQPPGFPRP